MMIVPAGLLLLLISLISLSTLAVTNNTFVKEYEDKVKNQQELDEDTNCILYAERDDGNDLRVKFQQGTSCSFSIAGGGILAALSVAFTVVLVVKAFFGIGVFSLTALIELGMSAAGALWALIVASVITAGLNTTCQAYRDTFSDSENFPCCFFYYRYSGKIDDSSNVFFYESINTSRITTWIAMVLLIVLAIVYTFIVIRSFFGGRGSDKTTKTSTSAVKANPI